MTKHGKGQKSWQRVKDLVEALLDYALNDTNRISNLQVTWKNDNKELSVSATLEALRHLLKEKNSFKPNYNTSDTQVKKYIGEVLNKYLRDWLQILKHHHDNDEKQGNPNWNFTLKLWSKDKTENVEELAKVWGGAPGISIQINSRQNSEGKTEKNDAPADCPPDKVIRVAVSQMPDSVPVWKGRDELVANLTAKLVQVLPDGTLPPKVLAIIGQGGMGKTSLAIKLVEGLGMNWQHSISQAGKSLLAGGYECVMYFKAQKGTSFDDVAGFLLSESLGIQGAAELKKPEEKIAKIMVVLQQTRCLLVLDNLESILHPAVEAENPDCLDSPQIHRTISPDLGKLLNALVYQQHQSQTILTSREVPGDLADTRYPGLAPDAELVHIEVLQGVDEKASVEILQRQLTDKLADLQWISRRVEGHLFLLTQLVSIGKGKPGYLRKHPELVTKKVEPMLREQMARQSAAARDLVSRMCVLRVPIDVKGLTFLRLYTDDWEEEQRLMIAMQSNKPVEFSEEEISQTEKIVKQLVDGSLVVSVYDENKCEDIYSIHRLTAEFLRKEYQSLPRLLKRVDFFDFSSLKFENFQEMSDLAQVLTEPIMFALNIGDEKEQAKLGNVFLNYALRLGQGTAIENAMMQQASIVEDNNQGSALLMMGSLHRDVSNWNEAERCFQQALEIARKEDKKSDVATALGMLGSIERNRGNWDEAERLFRQSLALRTELGDRAGMASCWASLGSIERNRGNWDEAERLYRQCLEVETELGDRAGMASSWGVLGNIECNRGNWDEAERLFRQCLAIETELGDRAGIASSWASLGYIERKRGNWDKAERLYRQCLEVETELGDRVGMASSWASLGDIECNRGNWDEAEKLYRQSLGLSTELGDRSGIAYSCGVLGDIERNRGNWDEAEKLYRQALEMMTELGAREGIAKLIGCLGENELGKGNLDTAEQLLIEALGQMQTLEMAWNIAEANYDLARLHRKRGNTELAQQHYDTAHQIFQQLGAGKDVEKIEKEWHSID
ncbi:tetratricopeptide repeat protein [Microcoleus sp. herbarium19]|uniref:tetratricopeptide repeat protein n=1 Tax=unclassified Microcoleus TaxID=2642155 RepID=UPI002FD622E1